MGVLADLEQAAGQIAERVGPSVVRVGRNHRGAGVVVADGLILTNAHNLRGAEITVTFADDRQVTAQVRGVDVDADLAVLGADTASAPALGWDGAEPSVGTPVFAVAGSGRGLRVTFGLVSAVGQAFRGPRGRQVRGSIEHTAPLARGSSGSALVDGEGHFLGLNTNRLGEGFYLAVPADDDLRSRVDALGRGESPSRRRLGIALAPAHAARRLRRAVGLPERDGLLVRHVEDDGPAARAGVRSGDLIVEAGGAAVTSADDLYLALDAVTEGSSLSLSVVRGVEEIAVSVTFGETRDEGSA